MQTAVIYSRVSTEEQKDSGFSLQDQESRLKKDCQKRAYQLLEHIQDDHSAKDFNRPAFNKFLEDVKSGKLRPNVFLVVRMDRFSRNVMATLNMLTTFKKYGIRLECIEGEIDLSTPESLIPYILNMVLPEVDNLRRGLNTKRGLRQAQREGRCTSKAPFGYRNNKTTKLVEIDENEAETVKVIFETFGKAIYSSEQVRRMAKDKGCKLCKQAFLNMLSNPFYIGKILIKAWESEPEEKVYGLHPPIISEDLFNQVQQIKFGKGKPYKGITRSNELILSGYITCPKCGKRMTGSASKGNGGHYHYYHCQQKYGCNNRFRASEANEAFVNFLKQFKPSKEIINLYYQVLEDVFRSKEGEKEAERKKIEKDIGAVRIRIDSLEMKFIDDALDSIAYKKMKKTFVEQENDLIGRHITINKMSKDFQKYIFQALSIVGDLENFYLQSSLEIKRKIVGSIFTENLIYDQKSYRTTKINEFVRLISNADKEDKEKQLSEITKLSTLAPAAGLEPATL